MTAVRITDVVLIILCVLLIVDMIILLFHRPIQMASWARPVPGGVLYFLIKEILS